VDFFIAGRRDPFAQEGLASQVADQINHAAAHRRTCRGQQHIKQKSGTVVVDVAGYHRVQGQAHQRRVDRGEGENSPGAQGAEPAPDPFRVAGKNVLEGLQVDSLRDRQEGRSAIYEGRSTKDGEGTAEWRS